MRSFCCNACGTHKQKMARCQQCHHAWFCSKACQRSHWPKAQGSCAKQCGTSAAMDAYGAAGLAGGALSPKHFFRDIVQVWRRNRHSAHVTTVSFLPHCMLHGDCPQAPASIVMPVRALANRKLLSQSKESDVCSNSSRRRCAASGWQCSSATCAARPARCQRCARLCWCGISGTSPQLRCRELCCRSCAQRSTRSSAIKASPRPKTVTKLSRQCRSRLHIPVGHRCVPPGAHSDVAVACLPQTQSRAHREQRQRSPPELSSRSCQQRWFKRCAWRHALPLIGSKARACMQVAPLLKIVLDRNNDAVRRSGSWHSDDSVSR